MVTLFHLILAEVIIKSIWFCFHHIFMFRIRHPGELEIVWYFHLKNLSHVVGLHRFMNHVHEQPLLLFNYLRGPLYPVYERFMVRAHRNFYQNPSHTSRNYLHLSNLSNDSRGVARTKLRVGNVSGVVSTHFICGGQNVYSTFYLTCRVTEGSCWR